MYTKLTLQDARQSLSDHIAAKGEEIHRICGGRFGWGELVQLLEDRSQVRYPCRIVFDSEPLLPGECAHPVEQGARPEDGFVIFVHPYFADRTRAVVLHVLYQLVAVNYGGFATSDDAEEFGARALGMSREDYYRALCTAADEMSASAARREGGFS
jgi:hypothetical protein